MVEPRSLADYIEAQPVPLPDRGVGDIFGTTQGSGARFNGGKPAFDLVPLRFLAASLADRGSEDILHALACLGRWQERQPGDCLFDAMKSLGSNGWSECAQVFDYGKRKYSEWNWARGMAWSIPLACAVRHLLAMVGGEVNDPESGLPHRGHVMCNICMLLTYERTYLAGDDRPSAGLLASTSAAA